MRQSSRMREGEGSKKAQEIQRLFTSPRPRRIPDREKLHPQRARNRPFLGGLVRVEMVNFWVELSFILDNYGYFVVE